MDSIGKHHKIQRTSTTGNTKVETVRDVRRLRQSLRKADPKAPAPGSEGGRPVMRVKMADSGSSFSDAGKPPRTLSPGTTGNHPGNPESRRTRRPVFVPKLEMARGLHGSEDGMGLVSLEDGSEYGQSSTSSSHSGSVNVRTRTSSSSESDAPIASPRRNTDVPVPLFGLDPERLQQQRAFLQPDFDRRYEFAREHQAGKIGRKNYVEVQELVPSEKGQLQRESQWVRSGKTYTDRFLESNAETGKKIQTGFNRMKRVARSLTNSPRLNGSNYASDKPTDELLNLKKIQGNLGALTTQTATRLDFGIAGAAGAPVPGAANALPLAGFVPGIIDGVQATLSRAQLHSNDTRTKAELRHLNDAERFLRFLWAATPKEAKHYLQFDQAARQLLEPTKEERAARAAQNADILNRAVVLPPMTLGSTSVQIASLAVNTTATTIAGAALSPLGLASSAIEIHQGKKEQAYHGERKQAARLRKAAMAAVVAAHTGHPKHALLAGIVASLSAGQDRLIHDAGKSKNIGVFRQGRGAVSIPLTTGATIATGLFLGGVATALTAGVAGAVATVPILILLAVLTKEVHRLARVEHKAKWRQRAAQVVALDTPRDALEQKLTGSHPGGSSFRVEILEGEYLAKAQTFAGIRSIELDVRENEYVGLHVLALQIHDLVTGKDNGDPSPFLDLLEALGMHTVGQLAVCKAASGEPSNAQLDFIQNQLARMCLGTTFRMAGPMQALPHVSVFLEHHYSAFTKTFEESNVLTASDIEEGLESKALKQLIRSDAFLAAIRSKLIARYVNPKEGMAAFMHRTREFLAKTSTMSHAPGDLNLWNELRCFCDYQERVEESQSRPNDAIKRKKAAPVHEAPDAYEIQQMKSKLEQLKNESEAKARGAQDASARFRKAEQQAEFDRFLGIGNGPSRLKRNSPARQTAGRLRKLERAKTDAKTESRRADGRVKQAKAQMAQVAQMEAASRAAVIARETNNIEKNPTLAKSLPASGRSPAKMPKIDRRINSWNDVSGEPDGEKTPLLTPPRTPKTGRRLDD
jgi:hypothetical protein